MTNAAHDLTIVEDFATGLSVGEDWRYLTLGDFVADDGVVTRTSNGISIAPPARNADTGEPMFTKVGPAALNHVKWLVARTTAVGTESAAVRITFTASATCFGAANHPYGEAVIDPDTDIRLAAATLNVIDPETGMVFDFFIGQTATYPLYERLRGLGTTHESFVQVGPPVPRMPGAFAELSIIVDAAADTVVWEVDGQVVASIDRIGPSASGWETVLDHGGEPTGAHPAQVAYGLGLMTMLDASLRPSEIGLVDQGDYLVYPGKFVGGPALFGQGAQLDMQRIVVERG